MDTLFIPNENDFRRWIREAVKDCLENTAVKSAQTDQSGDEGIVKTPFYQCMHQNEIR